MATPNSMDGHGIEFLFRRNREQLDCDSLLTLYVKHHLFYCPLNNWGECVESPTVSQ
ncbi:hypothetical protein I79_010186 [Cricetulus griseus]|uniref:Uncharacterized protein n=1 Tax=Cricetulus griseus TaxID=10029 RepID=G3HHS7_CRIGR|nr:hypothetical protein I79_010186 [Cricetulus griseus]